MLGGMVGICQCVIGLEPNRLLMWLHQFLPFHPSDENLNFLAEQGFIVKYIFVEGSLNASGYARD